MYCPNCGSQLPDDAKFCLNCGKPQKQENQAEIESQYETCRIEAYPSKNWKFLEGYFTVISIVVVGPKGLQTIASDEYSDTDKGHIKRQPRAASVIVERFVNQLIQAGWEHTGVGESWWQHTFRRRIN